MSKESLMSSKPSSNQATKDIAALRARAEAFDAKMSKIKGPRPTMQEIVEECRIMRQEMYNERTNGHIHR